MKTVIIAARRISADSPRQGRPHAELWGTNRNATWGWAGGLRDWTEWYDPHPVEPTDFHPGIKAKRPDTWEWYKRQDASRPIYFLEPHPEVPGSRAYPFELILPAFPACVGRYSTSIDLMLAKAVYESYRHIILSGVGAITNETDCAKSARWQAIHQGIRFWLGYCAALGIRVDIEGPSVYAPLTGVYGRDIAGPSVVGLSGGMDDDPR